MLRFFAGAVQDRPTCARCAPRPAAAAWTFRCRARRRAARARRARCRRRARDRIRRSPTESVERLTFECRCTAWRTRRPTESVPMIGRSGCGLRSGLLFDQRVPGAAIRTTPHPFRLLAAAFLTGEDGFRRFHAAMVHRLEPDVRRRTCQDWQDLMPNRLIVLRVALLLVSLAAGGCTPADTSKPPASETKRAPFIGEITPVVSVQELMAHMIDPAADYIFDAVWWDSTSKGIVEHKPVTEEDWEKVETGAITIIEGVGAAQGAAPLRPAGQQHRPEPARAVARSNQREDRQGPGGVDRQDTGAPRRRAGSPRHRQREGCGQVVQSGWRSRHRMRVVPPRVLWYPGAKTTYRHTP